MSDADILYDHNMMTTLYDDLQTSYKDLTSQAHNLMDTAQRFHQALHGQNAVQAFDSTFKGWSDEYDNHLNVLHELFNSVEDSLHRAHQADGAVADGFQGF